MNEIPIEIIVLYDAQLVQKEIPKNFRFYYKKWLRYYLDFCQKYNFKQSDKKSLSYFIKKLKEKNQTDQQQKQASHAISIYYEILSADRGKEVQFNNKKEILSSKNQTDVIIFTIPICKKLLNGRSAKQQSSSMPRPIPFDTVL